MANSSLNLTSLDFNTLKTEFKTYLQTQTAFKDYNFDGSNMNVLLDVMSYNSYLNSFYLNMVASEMFLDSAQKLDSVVSHAKELNYLPKSTKSSEATISFTITADTIRNPYTIPKGTLFNGTNANGAFTFTTAETHTYSSLTPVYSVNNLPIYEGIFTSDSFIYNTTSPYQRFVLTNSIIDLDSLIVTVYENNGADVTIYEKKTSLFNLQSDSAIYFVQAAQNGQYEIVFGDGILGLKPQNGAVIVCEYRIASGPSADGINGFKCTVDLAATNGGTSTLSTVTVNSVSSGGAFPEDIESIRRSAPRYYAAQQRAISVDDYKALIQSEFGNLIEDINVYGGETQEPKLYGRVIVAIKPNGALIAPNYVKDEIQNYILYRIGLPTRVNITDPDYLYCGVTSTVQYDRNLITKTANELKDSITGTILTFSNANLQKFNNDFRYSKFVSAIDNTDRSITSNDTKVTIIKRIAPLLNYATPYSLKFENASDTEQSSPGYARTGRFFDEPVVTSSPFTYVDDNNIEYTYCYFRDDNQSGLVIYTLVQGTEFTILKDNAGNVNYATGEVTIKAFKSSYYNTYISIYMVPQNKDIIASQNKIIVIEPTDININMIETVY